MTNVKFDKNQFRDMVVNGYKWYGFIGGFHYFSKRHETGKFSEIKAHPEDITNGNLDYFTKTGWSRK